MRRYLTFQAVLPAILASSLVLGCGDDDGDDDDDVDRPDSGQTSDAGGPDAARPDAGMDAATSNLDAGGDSSTNRPDAGRLNDNQIVGVLAAVNTGEIQAGMLASTKGSAAQVKSFGMSMVTMHTAAQTRQSALGIAVAPSETSSGLTATAMSVQQNLTNAAAGLTFDRLYMESQVLMHMMALELIDTELLTAAMSSALRTELMTTRTEVMMHYTQAMQIRAQLQSDGGASDAGATTDASGLDSGG